MAAWKKEEVDAAIDFSKRRERQRDWESCDRTRKRTTCQATLIRLVNESKESCTDAIRTETCVAPRHACRCVT